MWLIIILSVGRVTVRVPMRMCAVRAHVFRGHSFGPTYRNTISIVLIPNTHTYTFSFATSMRRSLSTKRHRVENSKQMKMPRELKPMETIYHYLFHQMQSVFILVTCRHPSIRPIFRILKCHGRRRRTWSVDCGAYTVANFSIYVCP